jgi:hypothetical protein
MVIVISTAQHSRASLEQPLFPTFSERSRIGARRRTSSVSKQWNGKAHMKRQSEVLFDQGSRRSNDGREQDHATIT